MNPIKNEAMKAKEEMETKNPQLKLKHDPTQVLPMASGSNSNHPHHVHNNYYQHHGQYAFVHPLYGGPPVVQMARPNRADQGIFMDVRMVAGGVNIALANNHNHREPQRQRVPNQNPLPPANQN